MRPTVSIITPAYNQRKYIGKCIRSVISQTYPNWEQIIIDDFSQDRTFEVASAYSKKDKRIKVVRHKKNWGINRLADIYNQALGLCKGKYIAILEGDDFWPRDKLRKQINSFRKEGVIFTFGNCIMTNEVGLPIKLFSYAYDKNLLNNYPIGSILRLFLNLKFSIIPCTVLIRKSALVAIGGFKKDQDYPFTDIPTFLQLALKGKFCFREEVLGFYRKQSSSSWFNFAKETSAMGKEEVKKCMYSFLQRNHTNKKLGKISRNEKLFVEQKKTIRRKKETRKISIFLNYLAFKFKISPLLIVFCLQYIFYIVKKGFYAHRN